MTGKEYINCGEFSSQTMKTWSLTARAMLFLIAYRINKGSPSKKSASERNDSFSSSSSSSREDDEALEEVDSKLLQQCDDVTESDGLEDAKSMTGPLQQQSLLGWQLQSCVM